MAVLPIVEVPDQRLRAVSQPVEAIDDGVRTLAADMIETMYAAHGIGLAAIQIGVARRVVVIDLQERGEEGADRPEPPEGEEVPPLVRDPQVYINPEVVWASDETSTYQEGCLSIPDQYADVVRPARCRVRWMDLDGATHEQEMGGLLATCMQHEIDHTDGVLFTDHLSRLKRDMLMKRLDKARRAA